MLLLDLDSVQREMDLGPWNIPDSVQIVMDLGLALEDPASLRVPDSGLREMDLDLAQRNLVS